MSPNDKSSGNDKYNCEGLETLLRKKYGNELILKNYEVDRLVPMGENFGSNILKINTKVQRTKDSPIEDLHFVAKTIVDMHFPVDWTDIYTKEAFMYTNIMPFYKRIEIQYGTDENETIENIFPVLCGHRLSLDPEKKTFDKDAMILLENLKVQGYFVADKKIGLDMPCARKAIRALARFHALGIVTRRQYPAEFEEIRARANPPVFDLSILDTMSKNLVETLKQDTRFHDYVPRVEDIIERYRGNNAVFESLRHDSWCTIVHNDFWTNNMMFSENDIKFVDFQTYVYANVFVDLVYFLGTSLSDEMKVNHFDEMLDLYYENLVAALRRMDVISGDGDGDDGQYSRKAFDDQLRKEADSQFLHCALAMIFFTAEVTEGDEDQQGFVTSLFACKGNDLYLKKLLVVLKIYEERDWLH